MVAGVDDSNVTLGVGSNVGRVAYEELESKGREAERKIGELTDKYK